MISSNIKDFKIFSNMNQPWSLFVGNTPSQRNRGCGDCSAGAAHLSWLLEIHPVGGEMIYYSHGISNHVYICMYTYYTKHIIHIKYLSNIYYDIEDRYTIHIKYIDNTYSSSIPKKASLFCNIISGNRNQLEHRPHLPPHPGGEC